MDPCNCTAIRPEVFQLKACTLFERDIGAKFSSGQIEEFC